MSAPSDRFLEGSFAPVTEEITAFDLPVTGQVPGRAVRPVPAQRAEPAGPGRPRLPLVPRRRAWCTACGCAAARPSGTATGGSAPRPSPQAHHETWPAGPVHENMDFAANTHSSPNAGRTLATVEAGPLPYELTDELDTVGPCDFGGTLPGGFAAHTKLDHGHRRAARDRVLLGLGPRPARRRRPGGTGRPSTTNIPVPDGPMMHDFALTGRYVVLLDLPVTFSLNAVTQGKKLPYVWNAAHPARVGLLPRDGSSATSAGSRSSRAGSSTASTPTTTTAAGSWSTCASTTRGLRRLHAVGRATGR